jgi:hypothetical protein
MLFMVIERFKDRDPAPIYARLTNQGRALPDGLRRTMPAAASDGRPIASQRGMTRIELLP